MDVRIVMLLMCCCYCTLLVAASTQTGLWSGSGVVAPIGQTSLPGKPMPIPNVSQKGGPWGINGTSGGGKITSDAEAVTITYKTHAQGMDSGASFKGVPPGIPATSATLSYSVFFPDNFQGVKGGKLPGLCLGKTSKDCATGGDWQADAGSFRVMFQREGGAIGYAYFPLKGGNQGSYDAQGSAYKACANASKGNTGHDIWKKKCGSFKLHKGWNDISMTVTLNSPASASNGSAKLTVNGVTRSISGMKWRESDSVKISSVNFVSFFGGSDLSWATPVETYTKYKNLKFSAR